MFEMTFVLNIWACHNQESENGGDCYLKANICLLWMKAAATLSYVQVRHVEMHLIWMGSKGLCDYHMDSED